MYISIVCFSRIDIAAEVSGFVSSHETVVLPEKYYKNLCKISIKFTIGASKCFMIL